MKDSNVPKLNVLIIDDDEEDFFIISEILKEVEQYSISCVWSSSYKDALSRIFSQKFDLIFVDYRLGGKTGVDIIEETILKGIITPIIILTGKNNPHIDLLSIDKGAYDYLIKDEITNESIERSIRYTLSRYESKSALQKSEKKFRSIFEHSKDPIFILNNDFIIVDANKAMAELAAKRTVQLTGTCIFSLLKKKESIKNIKELLSTNAELIDIETEIINSDNKEFICLVTISKEKDSEDAVYFQGTFHDITHLKSEEQSRVQTEKFESTQKFIRMLAHEVRNPLNNIILSIDSLRVTQEEQQLYLDIAYRNSLRISDLIKQLLESFKVSEVVLNTIQVDAIIEDILLLVKDRILLKNITVQKQYNPNILIKADKEKIILAFANFVINAIEAMEPHTGILKIYYVNKEASVDVLIEDNGCGMDEEKIHHLFVPYFTTKKDGIGLGLSSALNILQQHNATITVQSEVNKGTTFTINFKKEPETILL
jgi:PAS domain S-box-containing protein